jgi:hypothetical protein
VSSTDFELDDNYADDDVKVSNIAKSAKNGQLQKNLSQNRKFMHKML